jgi:hypothetical protein
VEYDDAWREKTIETLKNRIIRSGLATAFTTELDFMMEATVAHRSELTGELGERGGAGDMQVGSGPAQRCDGA